MLLAVHIVSQQMKIIINYICILFVIFVVSGCIKKDSAFYIENARPEQLGKHKIYNDLVQRKQYIEFEDEYFLVSGHRIVYGSGLILAERNTKHTGNIDGKVIEKLTIFIPDNKISNNVVLSADKNEFLVFYSGYGVVPNISKAGCIGYVTDGNIKLNYIGDTELKVNFDISINARYVSNYNRECANIIIKKTLIYEEKDLDKVTPWEGNISDNLSKEMFDK